MIEYTTTYYKIQDMQKRIKVVQGGQGAGKNVAIAQILIEKAEEKPRTITVMSDTYDNLKDGSISDFQGQFEARGLNWSDFYNKTDKDLSYCGSVIQFRYISDNKADAGKSKRRDILYVNEGNKIGWNVASTFIGRTHEDVYIDHNPDAEYWAHTQVPHLKDEDGNIESEQIIVTYRDNERCPQSEINYIEARKDNTEWYKVYGLGQVGTYSDRRIYPRYELIDKIPETAKKINSGMDFGQSPDPTILVDLYVDGADLYIDERFCENNLMYETIKGSDRLSVTGMLDSLDYPKGHMIICDTDGRLAIADMVKYGYNPFPVKKNKTQAVGIQKLRGYNMKLTRRSVNVKKGIEGWFFKVDKNGKIIPEPDGHEPDGLAATRYGVMTYTQ